MNELEKKKKVLDILKKIDINQEFKDIISANIDLLNMDELLLVIEKYSNSLEKIKLKNDRIKSDLNSMISKYKNNSEEFSDKIESLEDLEKLINNI